MSDQRTGSRFAYERGDTVLTPLGIATIRTDPDCRGQCKAMLRNRVRERLISVTTFQMTRIIRKFPGSKAVKAKWSKRTLDSRLP